MVQSLRAYMMWWTDCQPDVTFVRIRSVLLYQPLYTPIILHHTIILRLIHWLSLHKIFTILYFSCYYNTSCAVRIIELQLFMESPFSSEHRNNNTRYYNMEFVGEFNNVSVAKTCLRKINVYRFRRFSIVRLFPIWHKIL